MASPSPRHHLRRISVGSNSQWLTGSNTPPLGTPSPASSFIMASPLDSLSVTSPRLSMGMGMGTSAGGYALGPSTSNKSTNSPSTLSSSLPSVSPHPGDRGRTLSISKNINPAAIFEKLGIPSGYTTSNSSSSSSSSSRPVVGRSAGGTLLAQSSNSSSNGSNDTVVASFTEADHLPDFEGLKVDDDGVTPTVGSHQRSSFLDEERRIRGTSATSTGTSTPGAVGDSPEVPPSPSNNIASPLLENGKMLAIEPDVLLPFADRPSEIKELLQSPVNKGLYDMLKDTFDPPRLPTSSSSSSLTPSESDRRSTPTPLSSNETRKWTWAELQDHLALPRRQLGDQDWIDRLKLHIYPISQLLWERLRACLGVDVDDERGGDKYEELSGDFFEPLGLGLADAPSSVHPPPALLDTSTNSSFVRTAYHHDSSPRTILQNLPDYSNFTNSGHASPSYASPSPSSLNLPNFGAGANSGLAHGTSTPPSPGNTNLPTPPSRTPNRLHRRTSSGGSSNFRRSFTMSSITENEESAGAVSESPAGGKSGAADSEDSDYESLSMKPTPGRSSSVLKIPTGLPSNAPGLGGGVSPRSVTPAFEAQTQASGLPIPAHSPAPGPNVELGSLLRLKGAGLDPHPYLQGSALSSTSASTLSGSLHSPVSGFGSLHAHGGGGGFALSPSNVHPTSPSLSAGGMHSFSAFGTSPSPSIGYSHSPTPGSSFTSPPPQSTALPSSLGLNINPGSSNSTNGHSQTPAHAHAHSSTISASPSTNRTSFSAEFAAARADLLRDSSLRASSRTRNVDDYNVFESDEGESVTGSTKSTGRGPGMRFSFSMSEARQPLSPISNSYGSPGRPGGSLGGGGGGGGGFALAGMDFNKRKKPKTGVVDESGTSTPKPA